MVERPEEYQWSSYGVNAWGDSIWLTAHYEYLRLGNDIFARTEAYRELFRYQLSHTEINNVRNSTYYCQPLGDERFGEFILQKYGIHSGQMHRGRPKSRGDRG
jgi:putative transposase